MAIKWPLANGVWSNAANWNDGTLPDVEDDVHTDGKTVTIDQDVTVASIRTTQRSGGLNGGIFNISSSFTSYIISADVYAGGNSGINITSTVTQTIIGNIFGSTSTANSGGLSINVGGLSPSSINITGNIKTFGATFGWGVLNSSTNPNLITNINGNLQEGLNGNSSTYRHNSISNVNILGNISSDNGGPSLDNNSSGNIYHTGVVSLRNSVINRSNGNIFLDTVLGNSLNALAVVNGGGSGFIYIKTLDVRSPNINHPLVGRIKAYNNQNTVILMDTDTDPVTLSNPEYYIDLLPQQSDVRQGTIYNSGVKIGTLVVPSPSNVRKDIPTDNTVGTADLTAEDFWTYNTRSLNTEVTSSLNNTQTQLLEDLQEKVSELYQLQGLDLNSPLLVSRTQRTVGDIVQSIETVGEQETQETTILRLQ